jgi:hypothetical protein
MAASGRKRQELNLLGDFKRVVYCNPEVAHRAI